MNDQQIIDFIRRRAMVEPPPDAVRIVMTAVEAAPTRTSWFSALIPAAAAAGIVAFVAAIALLIGQPRDVGPEPTQMTTPTTAPSQSSPSSPPGSPTPSSQPLLRRDDTADLDATDEQGQWGTIRLERGPDVGGYDDAEIPAETFVIEVFVAYDATRTPDPARFGLSDWLVRPADDGADGLFVAQARTFERVTGGWRPDAALGEYPGAIDIFSTPTEGSMAFAIPRSAADLSLELVYRAGTREQTFAIRSPGPAPDPVPLATPQPTHEPSYISVQGLPFAVLESAEADALFDRPDDCTNPEVGYAVTFPDDWYTNTEVGDVPACSWFTPEFYEVVEPDIEPDEIWISIRLIDGPAAYTSLTEVFFTHEVTIDGRAGRRAEYNHSPMLDPGYRAYWYRISFGADGPTLIFSTDTDRADDYELAKAVLDRIVASLTFTD